MANEVMGKKLRYMSQDKFETITEADNEFYAVSGSGIGFPSNKFDELTLGASGTEYTAPANGYFYLQKVTSSTSQWIWVINQTKMYSSCEQVYPSGNKAVALVPVQKGDVVAITYTAAGTTDYFRFIYAEGE